MRIFISIYSNGNSILQGWEDKIKKEKDISVTEEFKSEDIEKKKAAIEKLFLDVVKNLENNTKNK